MPMIIALGSNIGDRLENLSQASLELSKYFHLTKASRVYTSAAVEYTQQPDFYNQVLEFVTPSQSHYQVIRILLDIEESLGRKRDIPKGPRTIDLDLLFYDLTIVQTPALCIPHPRLWNRGFVVKPLQELPYFSQLTAHYFFSDNFIDDATPL